MKKRIIAIVLTVITIISVCAVTMASASAAECRTPHENNRTNETSSVINDVTVGAQTDEYFFPLIELNNMVGIFIP